MVVPDLTYIKKIIDRYQSLYVAGSLFVGLTLFSGCIKTLTVPNPPYQKAISSKFEALKNQNELLYLELKKLPEIQDGVDIEEQKSLEELTDAYMENKEDFDEMFKKMYTIGKPDVRKYSSPLQALFWLFDNKNYEYAHEVIDMYYLENLLDNAWFSPETNYKKKGIWLRSEAKKLYNNCNDDNMKNKISAYSNENPLLGQGLAVQYVFQMARENPAKFSYKVNEKEFEILQDKNKNRWSKIDDVFDRLNSPELLDYYIDKNISYIYHTQDCFPSSTVFKKKMGCCRGLAFFGKRALDMAGYYTYAIGVIGPNNDPHVGLVRKDNDVYFLEVDFNDSGQNRRSGPYNSEKRVIKQIGMTTSGVQRHTYLNNVNDSVWD